MLQPLLHSPSATVRMVCSSFILIPKCSAFPGSTERRHFVTRSGEPLPCLLVALITYSLPITIGRRRRSADDEGFMAHGRHTNARKRTRDKRSFTSRPCSPKKRSYAWARRFPASCPCLGKCLNLVLPRPSNFLFSVFSKPVTVREA